MYKVDHISKINSILSLFKICPRFARDMPEI